ncbi:hypothetical protein BFR04_12275 [Gaetbulibacter sp. 4G1]|nr:hypothetical protein BFR04_12275 [Gaetbulibacter sp. 4G1]
MSGEDNNIGYWLHKAFYVDYWNFNGRSRRKEFWSVILLQILIGSIFTALHYFYFNLEKDFYIKFPFYVLVFVYTLITLVPTVTVHVRRLHDVGKTGWWHPAGISFIFNIILGIIIILIIFIYGLIVLLFYNGNPPFDSDIIHSLAEILSYFIAIFLFLSILTGIVFLFSDSEKGSNKWGENPKKNVYSKEIDIIGSK